MPRFGIITGLASETRCFVGSKRDIACSGANSARARELARRMAADGCAGLVSFGLAGGLDPALRCGDLVLPESVTFGPSVWAVDEAWRERLLQELEAVGGAIAGSPTLVATAQMKAELRAQTGAVAVDMESHAVAAVAHEAGLPFVVVRVIADTYEVAVPAWTTNIIGANGKVKALAAMKALAANPSDIPRLFRLAGQNGRAMAVLGRVASFVRG